ncbi:hypothetical protein H4R19_001270 [Coemansia spiralis]|nr:hypothetical protein H4R19_001270 [Coemansia spiralis]
MKVIPVLATGLALLSAADTTTVRVAQDATVTYNNAMCLNSTVQCDTIPKGLDTYVLAFTNERDYERILLGFDIPSPAPQTCTLRVPQPQYSAEYMLTVWSTDNDWDEATVCGANKANAGSLLGGLQWPATTVDVTAVCQAAAGQRLSLFVDSTSGNVVSFDSLQSGNDDVFALDIQA